MSTKSRVLQDRRQMSRVASHLKCQVSYNETSYDAIILNLSLNGAYISSSFLPSVGETVTITLRTLDLKNSLIIEGLVVRGNSGVSDHGVLKRFGIQFNHSYLQLISIISKLSS